MAFLLGGLLLLTAPSLAQQSADTAATRRYSLRNPTPRAELRKLHPDRPGITESAFTIDPGHFQLETNLLRVRNGRENGQRRRELYLNQATLKLGLSEQTDVQVVLESYTTEKQWTGEQPERRRGFGDVTLRLKRNLFGDNKKTGAALALAGYVRLPTGDDVGEGGVEAGLSVPFTYVFSEATELSLQVRGQRSYDRDEGLHYWAVLPAATINHEFTKVLGVYTELMSYWDTRKDVWRSSLNVGPELMLSENCQLDFGAALPLARNTYREYFVGLTLRR